MNANVTVHSVGK